MPTRQADLITHPIRSRIIASLAGRQLTTQQIGELLSDVPLPSLYRHVRLLSDADVLEAVGEIRVSGTLTRVYRVAEGRAHITTADVSDATRAQHLQHMTTFLNTLASGYRAYLEHAPADAEGDITHALASPLYLTADEAAALLGSLHQLLKPYQQTPPGPDRRRVVFAHLMLPDRDVPPGLES